MSVPSLLAPPGFPLPTEEAAEPAYFGDLNLDQLIAAVTAGRRAYRLQPVFYTPLHDPVAVQWRQRVARDMEHPAVLAAVGAFSEAMGQVHRYLRMLADLDYHFHKAGWFLEAVRRYIQAAQALAEALQAAPLRSEGLRAFRDYLGSYLASAPFRQLAAETESVSRALAAVRYCVHIMGDSVRVRPCENEPDHAAEVERTFARFRRGEVKDYRVPVYVRSGMNHIEGQILDCVVRLFPQPFAQLDAYWQRHTDFVDAGLEAFAQEAQFFIAYLETIAPLRDAGLPFCYPEIVTDREIAAEEMYDLVLALKLVASDQPVVRNDFALHGEERIFVVTGPNQGGKTTFARAFGQIHYLAALGLPVPARRARLFLPDRIFTHFERQEDVRHARSKLEDDLLRLKAILDAATADSLLVMNEIFASTAFEDALFLGREVLQRIVATGAVAVFVTFLSELAALGPQVVSLVGQVDPQNPAVRTYRIVRQPANGLAYALALAEKHGLTPQQLERRLPR